MKHASMKHALCGALLFLSSFATLTAGGFVVIANESVPGTSISAAALKDIYNGKTMYWEGGAAVTIVYAGDKTNAELKEASGMDTSSFKTFWQRLAFSGRGQQPKKADDVAAAIALVASTKGAVAVVPADAAVSGAKKLELK